MVIYDHELEFFKYLVLENVHNMFYVLEILLILLYIIESLCYTLNISFFLIFSEHIV